MMEGTPIESAMANGPEPLELRQLQWAELVARFAAARDLRASIRRPSRCNAGSFASFANRAAASVNNASDPVNQADLVHGKAIAANTVHQAQSRQGCASTGDREL